MHAFSLAVAAAHSAIFVFFLLRVIMRYLSNKYQFIINRKNIHLQLLGFFEQTIFLPSLIQKYRCFL